MKNLNEMKLVELKEVFLNENGTELKVRSKAEAIEAIEKSRAATATVSRSESIAASWKRPEVARKRRQRSTVFVSNLDGSEVGEYTSVRKAFAALDLPDSVHIRYRMDIKAAEAKGESLEALGYIFKSTTVENGNPFCAK